MIPSVLYGLGRAGKIHYQNIMIHPNLQLRYLVELQEPSALPSTIKWVNANDKESIDKMRKDIEIQCVFITSPTSTHYHLCQKHLLLGHHVFVEKPISHKREEIEDCYRIAEEKGCVFLVGFNRRFDEIIKKINGRVKSGEIGKIEYGLTISRDYPYPTPEYLKISSGLFHDCASHDIDYVNWILNDRPISVYVQTHMGEREIHNHDYAIIILKYMNGVIMNLNLSRRASSYDQRCEFYGSLGEIVNNVWKQGEAESFPQRYRQAYQEELRQFVVCIQNKNYTPIISLEDCLTTLKVAEACQESVVANKPVSIKYGDSFRNYDLVAQAVKDNYRMARINQTLEFVLKMRETFGKLNTSIGIWDALVKLNDLVDVSDPDISHPNLYHAIQTAEMMRADGQPEWMQLTGLIHDLGKIMYLKGNDIQGTGQYQQWAMVGDTFLVGCHIPDSIVYPEFNKLHPHYGDKEIDTPLGIYQEGCGLDNCHSSWGHDEYLYTILTHPDNPNTLPDEALYIIRFHSLYLYHDKGEYRQLMSPKDYKMLPYLKTFNRYDLYSKCDEIYDVEKVKPYYLRLVEKYFVRKELVI